MTRSALAAIALALTATSGIAAAPAVAETVISVATSIETGQAASGTLERRSNRLQGGYEVVQRDGQTFIRFDDSFRAARGPDLKIFLSPTAYGDVTGDTAINGAINIGELQKTRGAQEYLIPDNINLADFQSILVHCEEFAVLWGGSDL